MSESEVEPGTPEFDRRMMRRAIALARRGEGRVEPNPMVGCVIVRDGRIIGEGYHRRFGGSHAEVEALRKVAAGSSPQSDVKSRGSIRKHPVTKDQEPKTKNQTAHCAVGATVYVSLEPCCHHAKTPPCTDALIEAGVGRVVVAVVDPNPAVNGRGIARLRRAGIRVDVGVCATEAAEVLAPFLTRVRLNRPYVIAKWAQSLDGKVAMDKRGRRQAETSKRRNVETSKEGRRQEAGGKRPEWISSEASRRVVHRLRGRVDAVLVGAGTVLLDDPLLTARDVPIRRVATRVIMDGRLRIPLRCQLVATAHEVRTLIFTSAASAGSSKAQALSRRGVEIVAVGGSDRSARREPRSAGRRMTARRAAGASGSGPLDLRACLRVLAERDVTNVLLEGGPTLTTSFLEAGLVDEAWVFVAPILIGGTKAAGPVGGLGTGRIAEALTPTSVTVRRIGPDLWYRLRLTEPPAE